MASGSNGGNFRPPPGMVTLVAQRFPINSIQELTLSNGEVVSGRVYCTDELTATVVLQSALSHTTLAQEVRVIAARHITRQKVIEDVNDSAAPEQPLQDIQRKVLEDRERKAVKQAMESLKHINQKASPVGQAVFDRLLKACGSEVVWEGTNSILVLGQVRVDAPYSAGDCRPIGDQQTSTLQRVQKIVATANKEANTTTT